MNKRYYLTAVFILVLVSFFSFGVIAASSSGSMSILGSASLFTDITYPLDYANYSTVINHFNWTYSSNTSAITFCNYTLNGLETSFDCSLNSVSISLVEGWNYLNLSILSVDSSSHPTSTFFVDSIPPLFDNLTESPADPSTYLSGQFYEFGLNWDSSAQSVWYEFESINYTDVYNSSVAYYFNRTDLAAGTYYYKLYANDSLGNLNQTDLLDYTINKADPTSGMSIVGNDTIIYGGYTDFSGFESNSGDDDCSYSLSHSNDTLFGAGIITFNFSTSGCSNYTSGSVTKNLTILQAIPVLTLLANSGTSNLTLTYGESVNASAISSINSLSVGLDRDNVSVIGENGLDIFLSGSSTYLYRANITGNENYSDVVYQYLSIEVNPANSTTNLSFNSSSPINYGDLSNFSCSTSAGLNVNLSIDGVDFSGEMGLDVLRGAGTYNVNCSSIGNENYTGSSDSQNYTIDMATPSLSLIFNPSSVVSSGTEINVSGVGCSAELNCTLYRDGIEVNNSDISILSAGVYAYVYNTTGNANYTNTSVSGSLTVNAPAKSGGGGGGSSSSCYSNWTCADWGACVNGLQTRSCNLVNPTCRALVNEPLEVQNCNLPGGLNNTVVNSSDTGNAQVSSSSGGSITGGVIGALSGGSWFLIIMFVVGIAAAYGFTLVRRRNFQNTLERTLTKAR